MDSSSRGLFDRLCCEQTLLNAWQLIKSKNSSGGIDGVSIRDYDANLGRNIAEIASELRDGTWAPQPYLRIEIPKNTSETRKLGLLSVKDKIIQQAILSLIAPRFENLFLNNSYGYRQQKGPTKAIHRTIDFCRQKPNQWVLRLDIDNYFDSIDHSVLFSRLQSHIQDDEVLRLIQLCVTMGVVSRKNKWTENSLGVPQGAILSPLLSNFYLHPFDQFVVSKHDAYVRYADDFVILCPEKDEAERFLQQVISFLGSRLHLKLNEPLIVPKSQSFEFLGIQISNGIVGVSQSKKDRLKQRIESYSLDETGRLSGQCIKSQLGIKNFYGKLLPEPLLSELDSFLLDTLKQLVAKHYKAIPNKSFLNDWLSKVEFLAAETILNKKQHLKEIVETYLKAKGGKAVPEGAAKNRRIITRRKIEYHRKEAECSELIVNTMGAYVGASAGNVVVRLKKEILAKQPISNLKHLTILAHGIGVSSNVIDLCMDNRVPVDFFDSKGKLKASILSPKYLETSCWSKQAEMPDEKRFLLAQKILYGKIKNQLNLVKYFNKYHAKNLVPLSACGSQTIQQLQDLVSHLKSVAFVSDYREVLMSVEAHAAVCYWAYIRELLFDDGICFEQRIHQGASDIFNSSLNYGYALLYARVWQSLLAVHLNPSDSVLHVRQPGKPTLVYDVVELFRCQAVDRIVISMLQKHLPLAVENGKLTDNSRTLLAKYVLGRFNRYEKYRGSEMLFQQVLLRQAEEIASFIANDTTYRPYISKW